MVAYTGLGLVVSKVTNLANSLVEAKVEWMALGSVESKAASLTSCLDDSKAV